MENMALTVDGSRRVLGSIILLYYEPIISIKKKIFYFAK